MLVVTKRAGKKVVGKSTDQKTQSPTNHLLPMIHQDYLGQFESRSWVQAFAIEFV